MFITEAKSSLLPQRGWLVSHGALKSDAQKTRDQLVADMNRYYYDTQVILTSTGLHFVVAKVSVW